MQLIAVDTPTALLVLTAECSRCRIGVGGYHEVRDVAAREGFAFRSLVASTPVAARQFALLLPGPGTVAVDADLVVLRALRGKPVPALVLVGGTGRRSRVLALEVPTADTVRLRRELREFD